MMFGSGGFNPASASPAGESNSTVEQTLDSAVAEPSAIGPADETSPVASEEPTQSLMPKVPTSDDNEADAIKSTGNPAEGTTETPDSASRASDVAGKRSDETVEKEGATAAPDGETVEDPAAPKARALALATRLANPQLPAKCGLSVAIVLDLSNSLKDSHVGASKNAAISVVDSLRGTPSSIGVFTFATFAPDGTNTAVSKTSVSTTAGANSVTGAINGIKRVPENVGGTNWDAALRQIPQGQYDIVLFVTDGNPTAYGTPHAYGNFSTPRNNTDFGSTFNDIDLSAAVTASDALKRSGAFVMGLAVGNAVNDNNISAITGTRSGTDYFKIADYNQLAATLAGIALKDCQGTVSIVKQVRDLDGNLAPSAGWTFHGRAGDNTTPGSAVTQSDGTVNFKVNDLVSVSRTVQFTETQQPGYALETQGAKNAKCVNNATGQNVPVTNSGDLGFTVAIKRQDAVSCEVINKMLPPVPIITKTSDPKSGAEVKPGDTIKYTLSFKNEGFFPISIDHVDHLTDVLDDADFNNDIVVTGKGLQAVRDGEGIRMTGEVQPGGTVTVTYSVKVKTKSFGNGIARNFLVPKGEEPVCNPKKDNCTEHPIPGALDLKKSSDPESGSLVAPGSTVNYTLEFKNTGASPIDVEHVDHLTDVLDDAVFNYGFEYSGAGLSAVRDGNEIRITGFVAAERTVKVTYSVTVKETGFGNGIARNFLLPKGENPPAECDPEIENCTEHPLFGSLSWEKVDGLGSALAGSEWELTGPGETDPLSIKDCIADSAAGCSGPDRDPSAGEFELRNLDWGTYTLVETRAPAGYLLDPTVHDVVIGEGSPIELAVLLDPIVNEQQPALALPLTGGLGSQSFLFGGGATLLVALALVGWRRRKGASL